MSVVVLAPGDSDRYARLPPIHFPNVRWISVERVSKNWGGLGPATGTFPAPARSPYAMGADR